MITHLLKNSRASGIGPENATRPSAKRKTLECKKYKFDINCSVSPWMISHSVLSTP